MKKILVLAIAAFLIQACGEETKQNEEVKSTSFTVHGAIENADSLIVKLQRRVDGEWVVQDSARVFDKTFSLNGNSALPELFFINVGGGRNYIQVFAEADAEIQISANMDSLNTADIKGSPTHDKFTGYNKDLEPYNEKIRGLYAEYRIADSLEDKTKEAELDSLYEVYSEEKNDFTKSFIDKNLDNPLAPYLTSGMYYDDSKLDELKGIVSKFSEAVDSSIYTIRLHEMISGWEKVAIGKQALDFTQNDTTGSPVTLSSLQGNYVLIDFWASWCGPCRAENPNVVKLYEELHEKGFEIIGVSLDSKRDNWIKAIHEDNLGWYHVSDLQGWKNEVGDMYSVRAIPHTVLLDKEGIIIAKNLRGEELREKLEELLL